MNSPGPIPAGCAWWLARWADQSHCFDVPGCEQPGVARRHLRQVREIYYEQAQGLVEGGVDILLVETVFDTLNAKAALFAIDEYFEASGIRSR